MTGRPRVAILVHATDRTGPPMYLRSVLEHLGSDELDLVVVALRGGELLDDLARHAEVRVVGEPVDPARAASDRLAEEPRRIAARRAQLADLHDLDLIIVNTAWSVHALAWLPPSTAPVLAIVHELEAGVDDLLGPLELGRLLAADRFVVGCGPVRDLLLRHEVDDALVDMIPYGIDLGADLLAAPPAGLGARPADMVVAAAAVPDRRKAPDLFVQLAAAVRRRRPELPWAFRWIGAREDDPRLADALADRALLGLDDVVRFLPPTPALRATLASADAFVLTSREDAFPLAALEAAIAGLPIACFDTGGMAELAGGGAGAVVPFPDVEAMADVVASWGADPAERRRIGATARGMVRERHDVAQHGRSLRDVVDGLLERSEAGVVRDSAAWP
jgi:glycosyltransferase involved in cell wall biosynthesis